MFIVGPEVPDGSEIETDLCIVGAGAAGLTLARELADTRIDVCLLESGDFEPHAPTQAMARGELAGHPTFPLEASRLRYFGGTTNHWEGRSRPLEPLDFERRPWVEHSGWPFDRDHLDPYYARAHEACGLGRYEYDARAWESRWAPALPLPAGDVTSQVTRRRPFRFGLEYRDLIAEAPNITCYLDSNLVHIGLHPAGGRVDRLEVRTLAGTGFRVRPRTCVLATGAIENARLLLHSNDVHESGVGNRYDLVGRYYMDHLRTWGAVALLSDPDLSFRFYQGGPSGEAESEEIEGYLGFTPEFIAREQLQNVKVFLRAGPLSGTTLAGHLAHLFGSPSDGSLLEELARSLRDVDDVSHYLYRRLFRRPAGVEGLRLQTFVEPVPNPDSRVRLTNERDALGIRRVRLTWRFGNQEPRTIRIANRRLALAFGEAGLGRLKIQPEESPDGWRANIEGDWHQMGTTRMNDDPRRGVVDPDCRVHGVGNLYVASGSVFPTAGHTNPTLTIVALALRLADHLRLSHR